jgi:glycosyltransferase involved in cell wall biosynthesis
MSVSKKPKIALFLPFLKGDAKGGAEKMFLDLKEHFEADCFIGGIDLEGWGKENSKQDSFVYKLWHSPGKVFFFHTESKIPIYRLLKRQFFLLFSSKVKQMNEYDIIIFSFGNIFFLPQRISKKVYKIGYCHTPPRSFTDQLKNTKQKLPSLFSPFIDILAKIIVFFWAKAYSNMNLKIANSVNIKNRIKKYTKIEVQEVVFPYVDTTKFKFISSQDYFLSYARLEEAKRIPLIIQAFQEMPDKKLVICSSGPLSNWLINKIKSENLKNIDYKGRVSDQELLNLVGNCRAGIFIPKDEDAGMTQIELMSAGKPVIGVAEGGLLESILDKKTGFLLPKNISVEDLKKAVKNLTPEIALDMRRESEMQAQNFSKEKFMKKIQKLLKA